MSNTALATTEGRAKRSLVEKFAGRYGLEPAKMMSTLKATAFRQKGQRAQDISNEQMAALLVVADQYNLNPWTKEIYAYPDNGAIVPVVGLDGWSRIINEHPAFDGLEFRYSTETIEGAEHRPCPAWCEVVIYRKDRANPTPVREYFDEVYRPPFKQGMRGPWQSHTKRMLRHKTLIQGARVAFGFVGIHDQDEAERIIEAEYERREPAPPPAGDTQTDRVKSALGIAPAPAELEEEPESSDSEAGEAATESAS